jgi:hypothetical protein
MKTIRYLVAGSLLGLAVQFIPINRANAGQTSQAQPQTSVQVINAIMLAENFRKSGNRNLSEREPKWLCQRAPAVAQLSVAN